MRLLLFITFVVSAFVSTDAFADPKDVIDTGKGVTFEKTSGWAPGPKKKGTVAVLVAAGDEANQIEFRWASVAADKLEQYFNSFHASLTGAGLKRVAEPAAKQYGGAEGELTEYALENPDGSKTSVFVYQFARADGAWLVVGMFTAERRDANFSALEKMLGTLKLSP